MSSRRKMQHRAPGKSRNAAAEEETIMFSEGIGVLILAGGAFGFFVVVSIVVERLTRSR